ncbi:MAG: tetratricopeptide repeat protein [Verrucomicrobia bacterium]|nr:tetratricopeptide repeat protein [Verrucomicrobiota bacterium]
MKQRTKDLICTAVTACLGVVAFACALPACAQVADTNNTARFQPSAMLVQSDLKPESVLQPESGRGLPQSKMPAPVREAPSSTWQRFGRQQPFVVVSDKTNVVIRSAREEATAKTGASGPAAMLVPSDPKSTSTLQPESGRGLPQPKTLAPASERRSSTWERFGRQRSAVVAPPLDRRVPEQPQPPASDAHQSQELAVSGASFQARAAMASTRTGELGSSPHLPVLGKGSSQLDRPGLAAVNTNITTLASLLKAPPPLPPFVPSSALGSNVATAWLPPPFVRAPVVSNTAPPTAATSTVTLPSLPEALPPPPPSAPPAVPGTNAAPARLSSTFAPAPIASETNRLAKATQSQAPAGSRNVGVPPSGGTNGVKSPAKSWTPTGQHPRDLHFQSRPAATNTTARSSPPRATTPPPPSAPVSAAQQLALDLKPLVDEARELYGRQQYEEAAAKYREILKRDPENLFGLSNLAVIRFQQDRLEEAEHLLNRALQIAPDDAYSHATIGIIYFKQDRLDDAVEELTRSLKLNPDNAEAHNYLGIACWKKGWSSSAEQELRRALELRPDYADAHYNLAMIYTSQKTPFLGLARFHYRKTLELGRPRDSDLEKTLAGGKPEKPSK